MVPYTVSYTEPTFLVPRDSQSPAVPPKFRNLGDGQKKFSAPHPLQNLDQVSAAAHVDVRGRISTYVDLSIYRTAVRRRAST